MLDNLNIDLVNDLRNDSGQSKLNKLLAGIESEHASADRKLKSGLKKSEFEEVKSYMAALSSAKNIVKAIWTHFHK